MKKFFSIKLNILFDYVQTIVLTGSDTSKSLQHRFIIYPFAVILYTVFWWFE